MSDFLPTHGRYVYLDVVSRGLDGYHILARLSTINSKIVYSLKKNQGLKMDGTQSKPEQESDNWSKNLGAINDRLSSQLSVTSSLLTLAIRVSNIKLIL